MTHPASIAEPHRGPPPDTSPLPRGWYSRGVHEVARDLLGTLLCREWAGELRIGRVVEVEAYDGPHDRASHARAGLTARTAPMFGPPGHAYVYLVYGIHHCLNIVAHPGEGAGAILVRAIEPVAGFAGQRSAAGPGLVGRALSVDRTLSGHDLTTGCGLWLAAGAPVSDGDVARGPRVGVDYAGPDWSALAWRLGVRGSPALSRPFPTR